MMRISTKGRYALRIMLDLARQEGCEPVSLHDIAERQHITQKYMESIMSILLRAKLVLSVRGKSGGYRLARAASEYSVYEILNAAEGSMAPVACLTQNPPGCELAAQCATLPLWVGLNTVIRDYLTRTNLADLAQGKPGDSVYCDYI
ncbi:MAG: Rrf2 family transcriptional regulator [Akkermansia sp.]|nr:Rrf2 family transcriptional regulator [Akkermansia sp.]